MILPNDILLRETTGGTTVWVSHRLVAEHCGLSDGYFWKIRALYKRSLPPSWRGKAGERTDFLLDDSGHAWRWGRRDGTFYYDLDRIPNRRPTCYRDCLPPKGDLLEGVERRGLRESRERRAALRRAVAGRVEAAVDSADVDYYMDFRLGDKRLFNQAKARQLAASLAWCRFVRTACRTRSYRELGFATQAEFLELCAGMLSAAGLEGLKVGTAASLRKKIAQSPEDDARLRDSLVSGRYGNDYRRIVGKRPLVDRSTGEVLCVDEHQAVMMTYWLNPGGSAKGCKRELWEAYSADMESAGIRPVSLSTFTHYTNTWANRLLTARERHGDKHFRDAYRPYVPSRPLEYANSLWASDGSGVVPYRYRDRRGAWRMMKLYVMLISDVASRCIAGYAVSRRGGHTEDFRMLREAMTMALRSNGRTEVLDFISDNHGAYTGAESKAYLQMACRNFRTIAPGNSQANPAETMFRLFKRRFKTRFSLPETSWNARSLDSMANPDYFDPALLPDYEGALALLAGAVDEWNGTPMRNGLTPRQWFDTLKNPKAGRYDDRRWRLIAGEVSRADLSYRRSVLTLVRDGATYGFDVPSDADSVALIARHMGYASGVPVTVHWDAGGADLYTGQGVYILSCEPLAGAPKSLSEADDASMDALARHCAKGREADRMAGEFVESVALAREVMFREYGLNVGRKETKERYNALCGAVSEQQYAAKACRTENVRAERPGCGAGNPAEADAAAGVPPAADGGQAAVGYHRRRISDLSKYTK